MITLFIIMGLALLGGGLATIVDGLPYLVLERGFTQVLGGVTAATGGIIVLALAWVLVEIRRVRSALQSSMPTAQAQPTPAVRAPEPGAAPHAQQPLAPAAESMPGQGQPTVAAPPLPLGPLAVGTGLVVGAGLAGEADTAALAATPPDEAATDRDAGREPDEQELDEQEPHGTTSVEDDTAATRGESASGEPAAFATAATEPADMQALEPSLALAPDTGPEPVGTAAAADGWAPASWPEAAAPARASDPFAEAIAAAMRPHEYEAPRIDLGRERSPPLAEGSEGIDLLRESFAVVPSPATGSEPEPEPEPADAWMLAVRRDDSWLGSLPSVVENEVAPPAAAAPVPEDASSHAYSARPDIAPESDLYAEPASHAEPETPAALPASDVADTPARPDAPASSDEGIIGAYQVGDAHFTIYSDGSIKARTPDGDYDFDSMDELKAYLASEKNRLGL